MNGIASQDQKINNSKG